MARPLSELLYGIGLLQTAGSMAVVPTGIAQDSRRVAPGYAFVAIKGTQADGHDYIGKAIILGATTIVCEHLPPTIQEGISYAVVKDGPEALGQMACSFFGHPSKKLKLVAITGTNGKTTVATLAYQLFTAMGYRCGLLSTVQNIVGTTAIVATHTTPDAISLNALLARMVAEGISHAFIEASSHAIHQRRIAGLHFAGAVFTNLTHDHLDYHGTFQEYLKAKQRLFTDLPPEAFALSNADEKNGKVMLQNSRARHYYYGLANPANYKGKYLSASIHGNEVEIDNQIVWFLLPGRFNASNCMAVYGLALLLKERAERVLPALSAIKGAEGRFQVIRGANGQTAIVDYAHTPDALQNVLSTLRELCENGERIITVVGCGGDRDTTKRPEMGAIAAKLSDKVVLTADNPRSEDPVAIIDQMALGVGISARRKLVRQPDRAQAIATALEMAMPGDIVLVAGKGHETYQEIKGQKFPFSDVEVLLGLISPNTHTKPAPDA